MNKKLITAITLLSFFIAAGCKKHDKVSPAPHNNTKKSPVPYLRFNGVDGMLILSHETDYGKGMVPDTNGNVVDSTFSIMEDDIYGYFPTDASNHYFEAGAIHFNGHAVPDAGDSTYWQDAKYDTFALDTNATFASNWVVQGSADVPGFSNVYSGNNIPSYFGFTIDTVVSKAGYTINLNTGTGLMHADSIVYGIFGTYSGNYVIKTTTASTPICNFTASDLNVFDVGEAVSVQVIAYNYRHQTINGRDIYFINQRAFVDNSLAVTY